MSNLGSHFSNASTGSLKWQQLDYNVYKVLSAQRFGNASNVSYNADTKEKLCGCIYEGALSDLQHNTMIRSLYVNSSISHVFRLFLRAPDVELHCTDEHYSSSLSSSTTSNCVYALNASLTPPRNQLCTIDYFLKHTITFKNTTTAKPSQHISAYIQWFNIHVLPEQHLKYLGETVDIWSLLLSITATYQYIRYSAKQPLVKLFSNLLEWSKESLFQFQSIKLCKHSQASMFMTL